MSKQDIFRNYGIENYEELFDELTKIKDDLVNPEIKLSEAISKVKKAKEINIILTKILEEAEKEVSDITDIESSENDSYSDTENEADFDGLFAPEVSDDEIPF